jgi:hypothetical protein
VRTSTSASSPSSSADDAVDRSGTFERIAGDEEQVLATVRGRRWHDRRLRAAANRHDHDRARRQSRDRHRQPRAADVGAGDHRHRDGSDDHRQLPRCEDVLAVTCLNLGTDISHADLR